RPTPCPENRPRSSPPPSAKPAAPTKSRKDSETRSAAWAASSSANRSGEERSSNTASARLPRIIPCIGFGTGPVQSLKLLSTLPRHFAIFRKTARMSNKRESFFSLVPEGSPHDVQGEREVMLPGMALEIFATRKIRLQQWNLH